MMPTKMPLGDPVDFKPVPPPSREPLRGRHVLVRPLNADADADGLYAASHPPAGDPSVWTYLPDGPYASAAHLRRMLSWAQTCADPLYFTLASLPDERPAGVASYLRITPDFGVIEIGHIWLGPLLQRSTAATEASIALSISSFSTRRSVCPRPSSAQRPCAT